MTPEKLAECIRSSGIVGDAAIALSAASDAEVIDQYLCCSCCQKRCVESDTDLEFLILQSSNLEDFDRNVFAYTHGGPLSASEEQLVKGAMISVVKQLLLHLGIERQLGLIRDEKLAQEAYHNLCQYLSQYIVDSVNKGYQLFAAANPKP
jgi:hypothetical protein